VVSLEPTVHGKTMNPLICSEEAFLCGAEGADSWLSQHFDDYIRDIDTTFDADLVEIVPTNELYGLVESRDSALLLRRSSAMDTWEGAEVVGYYNTPGAVCIQDEHQGQGLGAELILWTALHLTSGPPTEGLDEQCFSVAGYGAHQAAWRLGVKRGLIVEVEPVEDLEP
jgi:GNAT superfamily N-acetyltransferase